MRARRGGALTGRLSREGELGNLTAARLAAAEQALSDWRFTPSAPRGFVKAEVTARGVSTAGLSSKTMKARAVSGLYVIGETVDISGWLGGYNFQWAWASGRSAGQVI